MSFTTSVQHAKTVLESVAGVENVTVTPLTGTSRAAAETARGVVPGGKIQSWEILGVPIEEHQGASGMQRTRARLKIRAWWHHADQDDDSLLAFWVILAAVQAALLNPTTGFPQITAAGVQPLVEPDMPRKMPTGQSGWYAELGFELHDCEHT